MSLNSLSEEVKNTIISQVFHDSTALWFSFSTKEDGVHLISAPDRFKDIPRNFDHFPEDLMLALRMDEGDRADFEKMAKDMREGKENASCQVQVYSAERHTYLKFTCFRVSSFGEYGDDVLCYGLNQNIKRRDERRLEQQKIALESMKGDAIAAFMFTVTKDEKLAGNGINASLDRTALASVPENVRKEADEIISPELRQGEDTLAMLLNAASQIPDENHRRQFIQKLSHEGFIQAYEEDRHTYSFEYERWYKGELIWVETTVNLLKAPDTDEIYAFVYTKDIDDDKVNEKIIDLVLSQSCDFIAMINIFNETVHFRHIGQQIRDIAPEWKIGVREPYREVMIPLLMKAVPPSEVERLQKSFSKEAISDALSTRGSYVVIYDYCVEGMPVMKKQIQFMWLNDTRLELLCIQQDITAAYEQQLLQERMQKEAVTDSLTGLMNRRGIRHALDELEIRYNETGQLFTLSMCDIDFFKRVNDTYGHDTGDLVLHELAEMFRGLMKDYGEVGRMGGEEYLLMFHDATPLEVVPILDEFRQKVENHVFRCRGDEVRITLTFGVQQYRPGTGIMEIIDVADKKLYHGKQNGRNQVVN